MEKFSYHRVYNEIDHEVYGKKGFEKWKNFRITIQIRIYNMTEKEVCRKNIFVQRTSVYYSIYGKLKEEGWSRLGER